MSFQAMAWAIKQPIPCQDKMVLLVLANYANDDATCYPSVNRLSADCGLSESKVRKCVAKLEKLGLARRHMRIRAYGQTSNVYELDLSLTIPAASSTPTLINCPPTPIE
jgi:predicted transcriptional regulator